MPLSSRVSKREPTRAQSATWARCSQGWGTMTTRKPLASVTVWHSVTKLIDDPGERFCASVFFFLFARAGRAAVDLRLGNIRLVDLDVVLRCRAQALDV